MELYDLRSARHLADNVDSYGANPRQRPGVIVREEPLVYGATVASARLRSYRSAEWLPTLPAA